VADPDRTAAAVERPEPFPPIGSYAFLSNCETGALLAPNGSIEWLCLPRFDCPSLFGSLLDRGAGSMRFAPDEIVPLARRYEPGTNIVETTWATETGWVVVRDALVVVMQDVEGSARQRLRPRRLLIRTAHCTSGEAEILLRCDPAPDYARGEVRWSGDAGRASGSAGELGLALSSDMGLEPGGPSIAAGRRLSEGERAFCALGWEDGADQLPASAGEAEELLHTTAGAWRRWLRRGNFPDHPWRAELQRSALTLKGLIHAPSGGMVAALTTSLPETPGGERNWDYRYTWIRDATFALWGLHVLGLDDEASDFMRFIEGIGTLDPALQIMYGIGGERDLTESTLDHLSGYEGARPVRIGNAAYSQRQNDVHGALLDSIYLHSHAVGDIGEGLWDLARRQVDAARECWRLPDQGIWEARGAPRHYVSSKLMCWVALDRGARLAASRGEEELRRAWSAEAEEIRADILANGVSAAGIFRQHYETDELDASTLLIPLVRFLPADDERVRRTVLTIARELTEHGLVLRYRTEVTDDGLHGEEGTFSICSFFMVSALAEIGEDRRARKLCERLLGMGGALDLYAEEIDPRSGRQLGNFPQAFTHLALINAVSQVIADERTPADGSRPGFRRMRRGAAGGPLPPP
jgi:GH15 family glucan-1,4-alpha-glucosidase